MAGVNIPKVMSITPRFAGVNQFISDARRISTEVNRMTKDINKSLSQLGKTSTATNKITTDANKMATSVNKSVGALSRTSAVVKQSTSTIDGFSKSLSGGLASINKWGSGFDATNNSLRRFGTNIANVGKSITRFSFQLERVGRGMLLAFTLPAIAAGVAIVKTALDWENALVKVENLVGVSQGVVAQWGQEILDLSTELGAMPVEMANGLYAAASGFGELAAQAPVMDVLTNSTMAAAIGLGEVEDIARAVTAMMNTFSSETLDASKAASLLVLGVREGNIEVEKLSTSLGNVLGISSFIGASADDVLAFIAAYTRFGVEPARAVTALNTAMTNLVKPSKKNQEILLKHTLTLEHMREIVAGPAGLANLFLLMEQNMSETDFISIFGLRSLRAVAAVTNSVSGFNEEFLRVAENMQAETGKTYHFMAALAAEGSILQKKYLKEALETGEQGMNSLEESFIRYMDTLQYKFDQIKSLFSQIFIGVDSAIAPFLKDFADKIIETLEAIKEFIAVNKESVKLILKIIAALAATGPAILIFAKVFQAFGVALSAIGAVVSLIGTAIGLVANLAVGMAILATNVGIRVFQAFLLFGHTLGAVIARIAILIVQYAALIAFNIGSAVIGAVGAFTTLGSAAVTATVGITGFLLSIAPVVGVIAAVIAVVAAIGAAIMVATGALVSLGEAIASAWEGVLAFFAPVKQAFEDLAPEGKSWGEGLIAAFSQGIYDGLIYLVDALNAVGNLISYWLKGLSPPRIAPDIDIWGMKTMQEWIDGWKMADFGVFNDIQGMIDTFLKSLAHSANKENQDGIIAGIVLGSREAIANAIAEVNRFGKATKKALDAIYIAIGTTTLELENYIEATLAAAATTHVLAKAQQKINDINEKYVKLLAPIQQQLKNIARERDNISQGREVDELNKVLARGNLPEQVAALARLRIKEIGLLQEESGIEGARDAELSIAESQLAEAESANDIAQERLNFATEALALQTKGLDTLGIMLKKLDDIKKAIKKAPKKIGEAVAEAIDLKPLDFTGAGAGFGDPTGDDEGEGGPLSQLDAKLADLTAKLETTKEIWGGIFTSITGNFVSWWKNIGVQMRIGFWKLDQVWGPSWRALKQVSADVWDAITIVINDFWANTSETREWFGRWLGGLIIIFSGALPGQIKSFGESLVVVVEALGELSSWMTTGDPLGEFTLKLSALSLVLGPLGVALASFTTVLELIDDMTSGEIEPLDLGYIFDFDFGSLTTGLFDEEGNLFSVLADAVGTFEESDFKTKLDEFFGSAETGIDTAVTSITTGDATTSYAPYWWENLGDWVGTYEGSVLQTNLDAFVSDFIVDDWNENFATPISDFLFKEGDTESGLTDFFAGLGTEMSDYIGGLATDAEADFLILKEKLDGIGVGLSETWDAIFAPFSTGDDELTTGLTGLGTGFVTLGTKTDLARLAADLLKTKAIELKDQALALLQTKVGTLRLKMETWRLKMVDVRTWVQNLIDRVNLFVTDALTNLSTFLIETVNVVLEETRQLFQDIQEWIDEKTEPAINALTTAFEYVSEALEPMNALLDSALGLLQKVFEWAMKLPSWVVNWIKGGMPSAPSGGDPNNPDSPDPAKPETQSIGIPSHGIEIPSPVGFDALPGTRGIGAATMGLGAAVASVSTAMGTAAAKTRARTAIAPSVVIGSGSTVATKGGLVMSFGDVIINNDMDMAVFEARVRNVVTSSMIN